MQEFIDQVRKALLAETGLPESEIKIETPRDPRMGDLAFPCFPLAKAMKAAPPKIAAELAPKLTPHLSGVTVAATGPYLNFTIDRATLAGAILGRIEREGDRFGGSDIGRGKTIVLDYSSPNIAKRMHVGHLRSTIIGAALERLFRTLGYTTVSINHLGDWGSQFGKLVAALDRWGNEVDLESDPIRALEELYVRFHKEAEDDESLVEAGHAAFRELESGVDSPVRATWKRLTELSMSEFDRVYQRLGVHFDHVRGEAYYEEHLPDTIARIEAAGITEVSDGALIVRVDEVEENAAPCLLRKSDGTTLYATRDLAALFLRWEEFAFDRALYVVGSEQKLHFRQLKAVLERLGLDWNERVEHVDFGRYQGFSSRKGTAVALLPLLDEAAQRVRAVVAEKNPDLANSEAVCEEVGVGAVIFNDLKKERHKDVVFDLEQILTFEGDTGPYVMFTHARLSAILRKAPSDEAGATSDEVDLALLEDASPILLTLGRFPDIVRQAADEAEPYVVSQYLLTLGHATASWLADHRVLDPDPALRRARLALVRAAKTVIRNGLWLLGVAAPTEM